MTSSFPITKLCTKCPCVKPLNEFPKRHGKGRSGYRSECLECYRAYNRDRHRAKRESGWSPKAPSKPKKQYPYTKSPKDRRKDTLARHGLSLEDFENLQQYQGGKCGVCKESPLGKHLFVDHCHKSGAVRGLLCQKCNSGIGFLNDSVDLLLSAVEYLGSPPAERLNFDE